MFPAPPMKSPRKEIACKKPRKTSSTQSDLQHSVLSGYHQDDDSETSGSYESSSDSYSASGEQHNPSPEL
ncbi:hypothetical protein ADUPG1_000272 [Aduncisulcus paluster]|uniref:Uncharacterized protein n=1 Tax=Aduncisulcus paluster TaxID=2918883 RepID=A0ABQ5K9P2_9EUKA|nr:hypothetical protein ADUPG1_000272 [Aduncisulcus paluster]